MTPISEIGASNRNRAAGNSAGFSLIEMLVVVFIIALASTVVVLNLPEKPDEGARVAEDIVLDLKRAGRESIATGELIAFVAQKHGYQFLSYRNGAWIARTDIREIDTQAAISHERAILSVTKPGERKRSDTNDDVIDFQPDLIFFPVGEATPAVISIQSLDGESRIRVSADASVTLDTAS